MERPVTSKSRGTCKYYKDPRGCFAGDQCKFLHCESGAVGAKTPYDEAKTCQFYARGFCKRGDKCWFKHVLPTASTSAAPVAEEDELCSICFDHPATYGLLMGCTHVFCITCIKEWRESAKKNNQEGILKVTKLCPMCRAQSKCITPSSIFIKHSDPKKEEMIAAYKESMARIPCRYFKRHKDDPTKKPFCPFGKDCFYQHKNADGTLHVFEDGADVCMRRHPDRPERHFASGFTFHPFDYRNPLEMIEVLSEQLLRPIMDLDQLDANLDIFDRSPMFLRNQFTAYRAASPGPRRRGDQDHSDVRRLEPIRSRSPSQNTAHSDDSMPILQDVSDSDEDSDSSEWNTTDEDEERDRMITLLGAMAVVPPETAEDSNDVDGMPRLDDEELPPLIQLGDQSDDEFRPPFVTDGRGRVIAAREETEADASYPRGIFSRMLNAFF